ncbi:TraI domain-containing protein [Pectobacterium brasiliense]|uniref:TraI domain-containing protein n=1 Tax=Pectobacterium brasiliense TaxID=180957 RepID=UPI00301A72BF
MFNRIKNFIVGTDNVPGSEAISPESTCPPGYHPPLSVDALILPPKRQTFLLQLNDNHALPSAFYRQCYLTPLFSLLSRAQNLPASKEGGWAYAGAFGDLTVQFAAYAVRLAKGRTLPPGIPPEEQAAQGLLWNAVVFWSALFYHLPLLCEWEGELDGGNAGCRDLLFREGHFAFDIVWINYLHPMRKVEYRCWLLSYCHYQRFPGYQAFLMRSIAWLNVCRGDPQRSL